LSIVGPFFIAGSKLRMANSTVPTFIDQLRPLRDRIDARLSAYTELPSDCPASLREAIRYSLLAPGKRLRPQLVILAAESCGGAELSALPAACAVEMIHAYSLIHDDLPAMDDDDLRRGRPTCHRAFGEAQAILAGDALLTLAFEVLAKDIQPPAVAARCCAELARAAGAVGMVGGQSDDISGALAEGGLEGLERVHRRKTGAMFNVSLRLGGLVAGANDEQLAALEGYGEQLGLAFQIVDDLLDVSGDEAIVGKRLHKDENQGKLTFPGLLGVEESSDRAARLIAGACAALVPLGSPAGRLEALARYVLERNL
jgi:geranylgeranyl diphosphate synthase type II